MKNPSICTCEFCEEFSSAKSSPTRILWQSDAFTVLPSIGSFTPGYLLVMPKQHVRSFADLSESALRAALEIAEQARLLVSRKFGATILAEHGPGELGSTSAACCDHAHWHLIPCDPTQVSLAYEQAGGYPTLLNGIDELGHWKNRAYMFLSPLRYVYWAWPYSEKFSSQFVRKVCAGVLGLVDYYDWGVFAFRENMLVTRNELSMPLQNGIFA